MSPDEERHRRVIGVPPRRPRRSSRRRVRYALLSLLAAAAVGATVALHAAHPATADAVPNGPHGARRAVRRPSVTPPDSVAAAAAAAAARDSAARAFEARHAPRENLTADEVRRAADTTRGLRIVVSLDERRLWVLRGGDTLRAAPVAIGNDTTIAFEGHVWTFRTPRGIRWVRRKEANPVWIPPDWHYVESARQSNLRVGRLEYGRAVRLQNGDLLAVRGRYAGVVHPSGVFDTLAEDEEIIFDSTLFIPPLGTVNRRVPNELGRFRLDMGNGYLLHGTPDSASIGKAATHGCIRLRDDDVAWLYDHVPLWTPVFIY